MPELPEVESVRRGLLTLVGTRVAVATLHRRDILCVPGDPPGGWERHRGQAKPRRVTRDMLLNQATLADVQRLGKELAILATDGRVLAGHLGMTGQFLILPPRAHATPDHVHASWRLEDGRRVIFRDPRRFGGLWAFPTLDALHAARWSRLGPDALTVRTADLAQRLAGRERGIKACLLDQSILAGVGNIYADEALFDARLHPATPAQDLSPEQVSDLADAIRRVLVASVDAGGSTLRDYARPDGSAGTYRDRHAVYGKPGSPCPRCQTPILRLTLAQRSTHLCPACQPEPNRAQG